MFDHSISVKAADEKACPFTFAQNPARRCVGDKCMAWRWVRGPSIVIRKSVVCSNPLAINEPERPANVPADWSWFGCDDEDPAAWHEPIEEYERRQKQEDGYRLGYCGLVTRAGQ